MAFPFPSQYFQQVKDYIQEFDKIYYVNLKII
jgi:hypothetical protein